VASWRPWTDGGRAYILAAEQRVVASVATSETVSSPNPGPGLRHAVLLRTLLQRATSHPGEAVAEAVNVVV
jgi:hypothetical protein